MKNPYKNKRVRIVNNNKVTFEDTHSMDKKLMEKTSSHTRKAISPLICPIFERAQMKNPYKKRSVRMADDKKVNI